MPSTAPILAFCCVASRGHGNILKGEDQCSSAMCQEGYGYLVDPDKHDEGKFPNILNPWEKNPDI